MSKKKPNEFEINDGLKEGFETFLELVPIRRLSHSIRELLFSYLIQNVESGFLTDFDDRLKDILLLFELFDSIEGEYNQPESAE